MQENLVDQALSFSWLCPRFPQAVLTDHIILRGRYSLLTVSVFGFVDHDGADITAQRASQPQDDGDGQPLPAAGAGLPVPWLSEAAAVSTGAAPAPEVQPPSCPAWVAGACGMTLMNGRAPPNATAPVPPPQAPAVLAGKAPALPLNHLPAPFMHALNKALDYYHQVQPG
jgi:hypothetical protein